MQEPRKPDFEAYSDVTISQPNIWSRMLANSVGCEFAIVAVVAVYWISKRPDYLSFVTTLSFICILGIAGAFVRRSNDAKTATIIEKGSTKS